MRQSSDYLHKLNTMRKEHGLGRTISNIGNYIKSNYLKVYLESYYVFEKNLDGNIEIEKPRIDLDVVRLNKYNYDKYIDSLIRFWPDFFRYNRSDNKLRKDIEYYFQCDDDCFLAMYKGEIAAMIWCGYQKNYMLKTVGKKIGLKEDEAIIQRVYVHDKFRGNHIYPFLHTHIYNYLHGNKINKVYGYVGTSNIISILSNMKTKDRCRLLYHVQINIFEFSVNLFPKFTKKYLWEKNQ